MVIDDPHDKTDATWLAHMDRVNHMDRVRSPSKPTLNPRIREDHDAHWDEGDKWPIHGWIFFWAFCGGVMWTCVVYSAILIARSIGAP